MEWPSRFNFAAFCQQVTNRGEASPEFNTCTLQGRGIETITRVTSLGTRPSAYKGLVLRLPSYMHAAWTSQWQDEAQGR